MPAPRTPSPGDPSARSPSSRRCLDLLHAVSSASPLAFHHSRGHVGTCGSPATILIGCLLSIVKPGLLERCGKIDYRVPQSDGRPAFANHLIEGVTLHEIRRAISGEAVATLSLGLRAVSNAGPGRR